MFLFIYKASPLQTWHCNSNTSHVLIYRVSQSVITPKTLFKYISCSYLSVIAQQVTIPVDKFKYISCSYLSMMNVMMAFAGQRFKYISCSYLSQYFWLIYRIHINIQIHLMFLFILLFRWKIHILHTIQIHLMFLFIQNVITHQLPIFYSNTSHVLIYLR